MLNSRRNIAIAALLVVAFLIGVFLKNIRLGLIAGLILGLLIGGLSAFRK